MVIPRYLAWLDQGILRLRRCICSGFGPVLQVYSTARVFSALMDILQSSAQSSNLSTASCSEAAAWSGFLEVDRSAVSCANRATPVPSLDEKSWVYILYSVGPRTEPWGTPA